MLYLSSFFGRSVSHVIEEQHLEIRFADFSIVFNSDVRGSTDTYETLIGQKLLYIQKFRDEVRFHFSTSQFLVMPIRNKGESVILKNNGKQVVLVLDESDLDD